MTKKKVFILISHYKPGYLAGGPIKSIYNLANTLSDLFSIYIYTQNHDFTKKNNPYDIPNDEWINQKNHSLVRYVSSLKFLFLPIFQVFKIKPEIIYLNSFFALSSQSCFFTARIRK